MPQCSDDVRDINIRLGRVEQDIAAIKTAFLRNDLGVEDYDGHRLDHRTIEKEEEKAEKEAAVFTDFKYEATKKIIFAVLAVLTAVFTAGVGPYLRQLLGGG